MDVLKIEGSHRVGCRVGSKAKIRCTRPLHNLCKFLFSENVTFHCPPNNILPQILPGILLSSAAQNTLGLIWRNSKRHSYRLVGFKDGYAWGRDGSWFKKRTGSVGENYRPSSGGMHLSWFGHGLKFTGEDAQCQDKSHPSTASDHASLYVLCSPSTGA